MLRLTASLVIYRSSIDELAELFALLQQERLQAWVVVDNAAAEDPESSAKLRSAVEARGGAYLAAGHNVGFGAGHNLAMSALVGSEAEYHLMLNPDILFAPGTLGALQQVMEERPNVGLMMPSVRYPDGEPQPLCKLLPTPLDFALRRFAPGFVQRWFRERLARYELQGIEETVCDAVPFLSGCFMFTRMDALRKIGGFDERYFLYLEDVDLCRRLAAASKLLYWPHITISHGCVRGAYRSRKLMWIFLRSAIRYFNRWGWMLDRERNAANRAALRCLRAKPVDAERRQA